MLESLFNKAAGLNVCNSIKKKLQHSCFSVKFANFLRTLFLQFLRKMEKCICCHKNSEAGTVGALQKKVCNFIIRKRLHYYREVFKNTYFEKHLWAAPCGNQHPSDKFRSSRPGVFCKKGVLRNFAKFTAKHLCQSLFPFFIELLLWLHVQIYRREVIPEFY